MSRSIPIGDVKEEYVKKAIAAGVKGKDFPMSIGPVLKAFPEDLDEMVRVYGKTETFTSFCMPTLRLNAQNTVAEEGRRKICKPEVLNGKRSGGVVVKVEL